LNTRQTIVAHSLYEKLGYSDVYSYPSVYKVLNATKAMPSKTKPQKLDLDKILALYNKYVSKKAGLVRDRAFFDMLVKDKRLSSKRTVCTDKGYVVFMKDQYLQESWSL
jgi:hypothetical protein